MDRSGVKKMRKSRKKHPNLPPAQIQSLFQRVLCGFIIATQYVTTFVAVLALELIVNSKFDRVRLLFSRGIYNDVAFYKTIFKLNGFYVLGTILIVASAFYNNNIAEEGDRFEFISPDYILVFGGALWLIFKMSASWLISSDIFAYKDLNTIAAAGAILAVFYLCLWFYTLINNTLCLKAAMVTKAGVILIFGFIFMNYGAFINTCTYLCNGCS
ncbi:hypothetical protein NEMIN01_1040 [Nematocida minor]|uniref:uncharacterized protein n=1 Tax=Nematocida minor TaxID=1912983 RepID=UPI002220FB26|nr:uncharacterized protein NEMIN01_1040 [Nematocida minor]KAI5190416.1 hypothetical protein NEMIN01_1040 [Nematocida minor]